MLAAAQKELTYFNSVCVVQIVVKKTFNRYPKRTLTVHVAEN